MWTKEGNIDFFKKGFVLSFSLIMESHSGTYTCQGTTNEKKMSFYKRARVYVGCEYKIFKKNPC